ncbi:metallopeptidase family protein [uncultured Rhodospira sp.]|uniref:metallopeptidase family protein n=1 Tax=uncultured Rhodospira sp. TaxID=1936189 RepID=UPI00263667BE|nr:metallopeptidase family protein [uncultured Rhodospira sp.]
MTDAPRFTAPPTLADLDALAQEALATLPEPMREAIEGVPIHIAEFPDEETCAEMGLESPFDLLGLYQGVALTEKSVLHVPQDHDRVFLYRSPILDYWCETGEDLTHVIRHVLIHEIGHHFGLSDADMEAIEAADEDES